MFTYDLAEVTALLRQLVAIKSYPGEEHVVQQAVADWFTANGITAEIWPTSQAPNIVVRIENGVGPTFMLNDAQWSHRHGAGCGRLGL